MDFLLEFRLAWCYGEYIFGASTLNPAHSKPPLTAQASSQASSLQIAEIDHRIANSLTMISAVVRMRANAIMGSVAISGNDAAALLRESALQIEAVAHLHRLLSENGPGLLLNICEILRETCAAQKNIVANNYALTQSYAAECLLPRDRALPIALIVSEAMTNAAKYAHPTGVIGRVHLACTLSPTGTLIITVTDDGVGLPEGFDPATGGGLGLRVIRALAAQLGATWSLASTGLGARFTLTVSTG